VPPKNKKQNPALAFAQRRQKNLEFFSRSYPDIYSYFKDYRMIRAEVVLSSQEDEVDLWVDGKSLYYGKARERAKQGVELFTKTFQPGSKLPSLPPPWPGTYHHPRFAHKAVDDVVRLSPLEQRDFSRYSIPNFYPLVVFQGVGLGYQIEQLVEGYTVENAIIIEPNIEIFAASLLTVNWETICSKFSGSGRSLRFLIGAEHTEEGLWGVLLQHLMHFSPIFPIMNLFLNERGDPVMDAVAKRLNREAVASLTTWGHYDDEIRQINNALHAFHLNIGMIPEKHSIKSDVPVIVVGSGPSLDDRIDDLYQCRENIVIVSAGTGLRALLENDIFPDFHVELESDYLNYRVLSSYNSEKLKKIRIVAASQICPLIWSLFGEQRLYFKQESPIAGLFGKPEQTITKGTPTCTNAALAICSQLGLTNIFLFGTDFGFRDNKKHHSSQSIYMKSDEDQLHSELRSGAAKAFSTSQTFLIEGVNDTQVRTTATYFSAKRTVEVLLQSQQAQNSSLKFFNCADGADIQGAEWLSKEHFKTAVAQTGSPGKRASVCSTIFAPNAPLVEINNVEAALLKTEQDLESLYAYINKLVKNNRLRGKKDMTRFVSEMSRHMEQIVYKENQSFYFMIRGTIRHFMYAGFAHVLAMEDDSEISAYLKQWKTGFLACIKALPMHFHNVTHKTYDLNSDPWVSQSINDPEN
jgi:hypothetical protein